MQAWLIKINSHQITFDKYEKPNNDVKSNKFIEKFLCSY